VLRLTITPLDPEDFEDADPPDADPILEFARDHIGDADEVTFEVVYVGHQDVPDIVIVTRGGEVRA